MLVYISKKLITSYITNAKYRINSFILHLENLKWRLNPGIFLKLVYDILIL